MIRIVLFCLIVPMPALAAGLCGVDPAAALVRLSGAWTGSETLSLEGGAISELREMGAETVRIGAEGSYDSPLADDIAGRPLPLVASTAYDVDRVDEALDATENATLADNLSDTRCGPEALPQFVAHLPATTGTGAAGTVTLIAYFDDRILRITELTLRSEETVIFATGTALLRPAR